MVGRASLTNEQQLMFSLAKSIYLEEDYQTIEHHQNIDWDYLFRASLENKVLLYITKKILDLKDLRLSRRVSQSLDNIQRMGIEHKGRLRRTLEVANEVLGKDNYVLLKTYRHYPYITHDVDLLVRDIQEAKKLFTNYGFISERPWYEGIEYSTHKAGLLEIEVYDKFCYGSMELIKNKFLWNNIRKVKIEGVRTTIPSPEGDILSLIARMNFQMYKIGLGDILYIYNNANHAELSMMIEQAKENQWYHSFANSVKVLNTIHRELFGEPAQTERYFGVKNINMKLPYIQTMGDVVIALSGKGFNNLARLPSAYSVRIQNRALHNAFNIIINERLADIFIKYIYH